MAIPQMVLPVSTAGTLTISITYNDATVDALTISGLPAYLYSDGSGVDGRDALASVVASIEAQATYTGWTAAQVTGPPYGRSRIYLTHASKWVTGVTLSADLAALLGFQTTTPAISVSLVLGNYQSRFSAAWTPPGLWTPLSPLTTVVDRDEDVSEDILIDGRSPLGAGVVQRWSPGGITRRLLSCDPLYAGSCIARYAADADYARGETDDPNIAWEHFRARWAASPDLIARWHPDRGATAYAALAIESPWGAQTRAALREVSLAPLYYRWEIEARQTGVGT